MKTESELTKKICDQMKAAGAMIQPVVASTYGQSGWPDRLIVHPLFFGFIEFKRERNQLSKLQAYMDKQINSRWKGASFICRFRQIQAVTVIDIELEGIVVFDSHIFDGAELIVTLGMLSK